MRFRGFYGNANAVGQIAGMIDAGRFPHAVLIDGPEGSGKRTLAGIIAAAAVCEGGGEKPCGLCRQCRNAFSGNHPDILRYSSGAGPRSFPVDTVRRIRLDAYVAPNDAAHKIYLLFGAHNMTEQAQNALLKILEEPPEHVLFVLTCEGRSRVLETIQSRCAVVTLGPVGEEEALSAVRAAYPENPPSEIEDAVRFSGGLIGKALETLQKGGVTEAAGLAAEFTSTLCGRSEYDFLKITGRLEKDSALLPAFLSLLPALFGDALAGSCQTENSGILSLSGCCGQAEKLRNAFPQPRLALLTRICLDAEKAQRRYANTALLLTDLFSKLWHTAHAPDGAPLNPL